MMTNRRKPILTLVEDTSPGVHDTVLPACDARRYELLGVGERHDNCSDNLASGMGDLGLEMPEEPSAFNYGLAAFWLLLWGRTFLGIALSDTSVRIDLGRQRISVANSNPAIGWLRKILPFRLRWEGDYAWSGIQCFFVSHKIHTKTLSGHLVRFSTTDGKKVPVAEFAKRHVAETVAKIFRELAGLGP